MNTAKARTRVIKVTMRPVKVKKGFKVVYMRLSEHLIKRPTLDEGRNLIKKVDCSHFLDVLFLDTSIFSPWPRKK